MYILYNNVWEKMIYNFYDKIQTVLLLYELIILSVASRCLKIMKSNKNSKYKNLTT